MFIIGIGCSLLCCKFLKTFAITFNPIPGTKNDDIFKIEAFRSRAVSALFTLRRLKLFQIIPSVKLFYKIYLSFALNPSKILQRIGLVYDKVG